MAAQKYIIELWGCAEVEAEDKLEAIDKAWAEYDAGNVEISEATEISCSCE